MNKILIITFICLAFISTPLFASSMSNQMFYVPSLATQNMDTNISELTNDTMLYNFNFADELNLIQRDPPDNNPNTLKQKNENYKNPQSTTKFETWRNNQQLLKEQENWNTNKNNNYTE